MTKLWINFVTFLWVIMMIINVKIRCFEQIYVCFPFDPARRCILFLNGKVPNIMIKAWKILFVM